MAFVVKRKFDLSYLGEGWEQAYINYSPATYSQATELMKVSGLQAKILNGDIASMKEAGDSTMTLIKNALLDGMGFDGGKLVPITKENVGDLPAEVLGEFVRLVTGQIDAKKNELSPTS